MPNRYANLVGSNKIKDEWQKINTGFDRVEQEMDAKPDKSIAQVNDVQMGTDDTLTVEGSTGITVTTNQQDKKVIITATGTSTPGAHGPSHNHDGADPIPDLVQVQQDLVEHLDEGVHQKVEATNTDEATSSVNAPLKSAGGLAIAKNAVIGGSITVGNNDDSLPIILDNRGTRAYYAFPLPIAGSDAWVDIIDLTNENNTTLLIAGRIGHADRTTMPSFMCFLSKGVWLSGRDVTLDIIHGNESYMRLQGSVFQLRARADSYGVHCRLMIEVLNR